MSQDIFGIPVLLYKEGMVLPNEGTYYLIASNGQWIHKDMPTMSGFVPVESVPVLDEIDSKKIEYVQSKMPKLPAKNTFQIKEFFGKIVEKFNAESVVILFYNADLKKWKLHVPEQTVSHGSISYEKVGMTHLPEMRGYVAVGTIHSHADFTAFHSGTDDKDEFYWDGLHVTFGHNNLEQFSISASIVMNGRRVMVKAEDVLEGLVPIQNEFYELSEESKDGSVWSDSTESLESWVNRVSKFDWSKWQNIPVNAKK